MKITEMQVKVIVITGATSGIGLSLLERILLETRFRFILRICILCRNMAKGEMVRSALQLSHKSAEIELVKMDVGDMKSVLDGVKEIKERYTHIDYVFMNAGIMPVRSFTLGGFFSLNIKERLRTGECIFEQENPIDISGIPAVFATNILGHFILYQGLLPLLVSSRENPSKIIWTTSSNAVERSFSMDDVMCESGPMPYGSSKHVMNALSIAINEKHNKSGVYSFLAEPGLVVTGISEKIIPSWAWAIGRILFQILRILMAHLTLTAHNGAEALVWLFKQDVTFLQRDRQYESAVNIFNSTYVTNRKLGISSSEAKRIFQKMEKIAEDVKKQIADEEK